MAKTIGEIVRFSLLMEVRIIGHQVLSIGWIVFCVARRPWSAWKQALILVRAKTVVRWQRAGFRLYWRGFPGPVDNQKAGPETWRYAFSPKPEFPFLDSLFRGLSYSG